MTNNINTHAPNTQMQDDSAPVKTCMIKSFEMLTGDPNCLDAFEYKGGGTRSHHPQELIDAAAKYGIALVFIEPEPRIEQEGPVYEFPYIRLREQMDGCRGLICEKYTHMVYWDGKTVHDPRGFTSNLILDRVYYFLKAYEIR